LERQAFWSVILGDVRYNKGDYRIKGRFIFGVLTVDGLTKTCFFQEITPLDQPFELVLPPFMFPRERFDRISPDDVYKKFIELLEDTPFTAIPEAPIDIPLEKIPPKKRRRILDAARKAREKEIWDPPSLNEEQ